MVFSLILQMCATARDGEGERGRTEDGGMNGYNKNVLGSTKPVDRALNSVGRSLVVEKLMQTV